MKAARWKAFEARDKTFQVDSYEEKSRLWAECLGIHISHGDSKQPAVGPKVNFSLGQSRREDFRNPSLKIRWVSSFSLRRWVDISPSSHPFTPTPHPVLDDLCSLRFWAQRNVERRPLLSPLGRSICGALCEEQKVIEGEFPENRRQLRQMCFASPAVAPCQVHWKLSPDTY